MTEELTKLGFDIGHRRVGRLMRENSITVKQNWKFKVSRDQFPRRKIDRNHSCNIAPNLLNRNVTVDRPNQK